MRLVLLMAFLIACAVFAEDESTGYYIERYPRDGIKQRPRATSSKASGEARQRDAMAELGASSTNAVASGTNAPTKAARYISPRVGSKEFAPSRLPEPRVKAVVLPSHDRKLPPGPKVTDKAGAMANSANPAAESAATNSSSSVVTPK